MNKKQLYLIDGYAFAYRAYYAFIKNPLANSKGFPTSAIYGFANYVLRLIDAYNCPHLAVVMDSATPTFRHVAYKEYKANREAMPDDLKIQIPRLLELLDAFNIPVIKRDGFEADDIIASLTRRATQDGYDVFLVTKDKDLMQLICDSVTMLAPDGSGTFYPIRENDVIEKLGVAPKQVLDYLAMVGDASDNIPGVPGIGPKSAAKILETHTVSQILENPAILDNAKMVAKFTEHKERLALSKMLATLRFDVDLDFEIDTLARKVVNVKRCRELLKEFEFSSMLANPMFQTDAGEKFDPVLNTVCTTDELRDLALRMRNEKKFAFEIDADSQLPRAANITDITIALDKSVAYHINLCGYQKNAQLEILKNIFEDETVEKIGYDVKRVLQILRRVNITLRGEIFDCAIAAYLVDPGKRQNELRDLANDHVGLDIGANNDESTLLRDPRPVCVMLPLAEKLKSLLTEKNCAALYRDIELPLVPVLADLEWIGVTVDTNVLGALSREYHAYINLATKEIYELAGCEFNINSPKQLGEVLFDKLGMSGGKKTKGGAQSTNAEVLEKLAPQYPIVQKIIDYREKQKLLSTYIDALPAQILQETKRIHTTFNQAVTATGRLSSTHPNLQNIPIRTENGRKIREAFVAPQNFVLVSADYSQIELRILAHLSRDPVLVAAFNDDMDIHTQTAAAVYGVFPETVTDAMRRAAKTINFGLMYGMGPLNLSKQLGVTFGEAKAFIESYFAQFPSIQKYMDTSIDQARSLGFSETLLGRRRYLPELNSSNRVVREAAERTAINTPVQGSAADIIKLAMINVHKKLNECYPQTKMLLQVHDELVFETPRESANEFLSWIKNEMESAYKLSVPLKVDAACGDHWGEAH